MQLVVVLLVCIARACDGGRRFVAKDGVVQELPIFSDENEWLEAISLDLATPIANVEDIMAIQPLRVDSILVHRIFQQQSLDNPLKQLGGKTRVDLRPFSLVQVSASSIFAIADGKISERYYNQDHWELISHHGSEDDMKIFQRINGNEYVLHREWDPIVSITSVVHDTYEGIIVADVSGRLAQRIADAEGAVRWVDCSVDYLHAHVYTSGKVSPDGTMFVVTHEGQLFARKPLALDSTTWHLIHGYDPDTFIPVLVLHATDSYVFVLSQCGRLLEYSRSHDEWTDRSIPQLRLDLKPAASVLPTSLFFITSEGLAEYDEQMKSWSIHGHPEEESVQGVVSSCGWECALTTTDKGGLWTYSKSSKWNKLPSKRIQSQELAVNVPLVILDDGGIVAMFSDGQIAIKELDSPSWTFDTD